MHHFAKIRHFWRALQLRASVDVEGASLLQSTTTPLQSSLSQKKYQVWLLFEVGKNPTQRAGFRIPFFAIFRQKAAFSSSVANNNLPGESTWCRSCQ
jgi:hypothetical protein